MTGLPEHNSILNWGISVFWNSEPNSISVEQHKILHYQSEKHTHTICMSLGFMFLGLWVTENRKKNKKISLWFDNDKS